MYKLKNILSLLLLGLILTACGSSAIILTPVENINNSPIKFNTLTEDEKENWMHLDLVRDTLPGMSVDKAYEELIKNRKGKKTIVAVLDSGIDIRHEDLNDVIWKNKNEVPNNGKDDDNNGYVDDVNGWNFLGDAYDEQLEFVRLIVSGDKSNPRFEEANREYESEYQKFSGLKTQYDQIWQRFDGADKAIQKLLYVDEYTQDELNSIKTDDQSLQQSVSVMKFVMSNGFATNAKARKEIKSGMNSIYERLNYNLNKTFKGRTTGDDPDDFTQLVYGDHIVLPKKPEESHGTHVAGVIAAERDNNRGMKGVANNVLIMPVRVVPNGDEYDKDVSLAIRYAVDNGAHIINTSFGKSYSPHSQKVRDAIVYAAENDVLIVNAAGNDKEDLDVKNSFPNDAINGSAEVSDNFISVGALYPKTGSSMVADFSNYGKREVDIFAPGFDIYSPQPENGYDFISGTSFAAPAVAGVAALIKSQYPKLSAKEIKEIILESGVKLTDKVMVGGDSNNTKPFNELSKTGKIVNAYNALLLASKKAALE